MPIIKIADEHPYTKAKERASKNLWGKTNQKGKHECPKNWVGGEGNWLEVGQVQCEWDLGEQAHEQICS